MTRRGNSRSRRAPFRRPNPLVLILCGAEKTESAYFTGLRKLRQNPALSIKIKEKGVDPVKLVRYAAKIRQEQEFDEVWCVVDVDNFDLKPAVGEARDLGIELVVSNPCFEYWLLLHHEHCTAHLKDYEATARRLKKHLPDYDKTKLRFADFAELIDQATKRARAGCPAGKSPHESNPATGVWRLVEAVDA